MKLRVLHRTEYLYTEAVHHNANELRLQPLHNEWQQRSFHVLRVVPPARLHRFADFHANGVHHFEVEEAHRRLVIEAESIVHTHNRYHDGRPSGVPMQELARAGRGEEAHMFLVETRYVKITPEIWRAAIDAAAAGENDIFAVAEKIMHYVYGLCQYTPGVTTVQTTSAEFFQDPRGVCQDYAHLTLALCRALKIPARYVSGYLFDPTQKERGSQASHAWCEVLIPGRGWHGLDPTNNRLVDHEYVAIATGRDYEDVAPVKGTFCGGGGHRVMTVAVSVETA